MKALGFIAAALLGALGVAPASAAPVAPAATLAVAGVAGAGQTVVRERTVVRRDRRGYRGNRWGSRRVCTTRYRHGRQIRTCRMVRGRRY